MTKPTKSTSSDKPENKGAKTDGKPDSKPETLKLKKEAAKPGSVASKDIGTGSGADAAAGGGDVKPVESKLVGSSSSAPPAAAAKSDGTASDAKVSNAQPSGAKAGDTKTGDAKTSDPKKPEAKATDTPSPFGSPADVSKPDSKPKDTMADKSAADKTGTAKTTQPSNGSERAKGSTAARPATSSPTQNITVKKTGFMPVVLGGVVAAGLGAAATIWALPHLPAGWLPEDQTQETALDPEAVKAEAVAAAEEAARKISEESVSGAAVPGEEIQAALASQEQRIAALEAAAEDTASAGAPTTSAPTSAPASAETPATPPVTNDNLQQVVSALQKQVETQDAKINELAARPALEPEAAQKVQELAGRIDAVQKDINAAQQAALESTKRAEAVAAIASLQAALERGITPAEASQKLTEAGIEAPEALTREVPSLEALQAGFGDASRAALRVTRAGENAQGGNMLTNFLRAQTGARSVEPREGDDPDAVLSRANASVENGDIAAALKEISALPDAAKKAPAMEKWLSDAGAYHEAAAALSDLSATNN